MNSQIQSHVTTKTRVETLKVKAKNTEEDISQNINTIHYTKCKTCFVNHFPRPNTKLCIFKKKILGPWQFRVRGGAKNNLQDEAMNQPLQNLRTDTSYMVNKAISCAKSHGIKVHRGVVNLANGD